YIRHRTILVLQWGRGLATAEGDRHPVDGNTTAGHASMGPRPRDRGRSHRSLALTDQGEQASMGPRPRDRGRLQKQLITVPFTGGLLQWGRGLATAEGSSCTDQPSPASAGFNGAAASRPRKAAEALRRVVDRKLASMGP